MFSLWAKELIHVISTSYVMPQNWYREIYCTKWNQRTLMSLRLLGSFNEIGLSVISILEPAFYETCLPLNTYSV